MYLKGTRQTERGAKGDVKAYAIPMPQYDSLTARKLANLLLNSGVEVHQTTAQMTIEGRVYGPGSYVVSMAQPKMGLVRWMLGRTFYPDNTYTRDREVIPFVRTTWRPTRSASSWGCVAIRWQNRSRRG